MAFRIESVTAGAPCYNAAPFVGRIIESLLNQTRPPEQILIIDDGSTDDTAAIAADYAAKYDMVQLIQHPINIGLSAARNTMIAHTEGDVLVSIDSDAPAGPELIEHLLTGFDDDDVAGVGGRCVEVSTDHPADIWRATHQFAQHWGDDFQHDVPFLYGVVGAYRTDVLRSVGGFDVGHSRNGEDVEIGARLRKLGWRLAYRPEARVFHERRDGFASIQRMCRAYHLGGHGALMENQMEGADFGLGVALRHLKGNLRKDVLEDRNFTQFRMSWGAFLAEISGSVELAWKHGRVFR